MTDAEVATLSKALAGLVREVVGAATAGLERRLELVESRASATVDKELGTIRERVAVLEVREPLPGPPGPAGAPGADGKDGMPGLVYRGVYVDGKTYGVGDVATWAGSCWHCNAAETTSKPGDAAKDWTLMVKAGRDVGRDTRDRRQ